MSNNRKAAPASGGHNIARERADFWDDPTPFCPPLTVYEGEAEIDTGLVNEDGTKIMRRRGLGSIGFDLRSSK